MRFARERNFEVRFIEFMPLDSQEIWSLDRVITADDMIAELSEEFGPLEPVPDADPRAPATEYRFHDGHKIGFIASVSRPFCLNCNRLRLTADGKLRHCLFAREETDVRALASAAGLRSSARSRHPVDGLAEVGRARHQSLLFRRATAANVLNRRLILVRSIPVRLRQRGCTGKTPDQSNSVPCRRCSASVRISCLVRRDEIDGASAEAAAGHARAIDAR